jgi:hypothetical protein
LGGPNGPDSKPKIQWAAIAAAHENPSEKPESLILARASGFEPEMSVLETEVIAISLRPHFR